MNSTYRAVIVAVIMMILLMNPVLLAWGNPPPGRWEKVAEAKPGEHITVYTKDGAKRKYDFALIDDDFLRCASSYSGGIKIELATIDKIIVSKSGKYAKHGALWGAAGGVAVLGGMNLRYGDIDSTVGYVIVAIMGAALGAGGGFLTGAAIGSSGETIYISKEAALAK